MKALLSTIITSLLIWMQSVAAATVNVKWLQPETYTDVRSVNQSRQRFQDNVFSQFEEYFQTLASNNLPADLTLKLTVTNLNLAGEIKYSFALAQEIRLVNHFYWPMIELNYEINHGDKVIKSDSVTIKDMTFLDSGRRYQNDFLSHEKALYRRWFYKTIKPEVEKWQKQHTAIMN